MVPENTARPMYRKGEWVRHLELRRLMRVVRNHVPEDQYHVWCEWMDGIYHLACYDASELKALPREEWPPAGKLDLLDQNSSAPR